MRTKIDMTPSYYIVSCRVCKRIYYGVNMVEEVKDLLKERKRIQARVRYDRIKHPENYCKC